VRRLKFTSIRAEKIFFLLLTATICIHARVFTLEKLLEEVLKNSRELRTIELEIENADEAVQITMSGAIPLVSASLNLSHSNPYYPLSSADHNYISASLQNALLDTTTGILSYDQLDYASKLMSKSLLFLSDVMKNPSNSVAASITVNQPLYAQGKVFYGVKIAKAHQRTLLCKHFQEKMRIKADVTILFYNALLAQKNVEIAYEGVTLAEGTHNLALVTHSVGNASELDTLNSRLHLESAKIELKKAQSDQRIAYETLITKTGIAESPSTFSVEGEFPPPIFELTLEEVVVKVRKNNPNLEQLRGLAEIQNLQIEMAKGDFLPVVFAGASVARIGQFNNLRDFSSTNWGSDSKIFLGLNWDIFTGLSRNHKYRQVKNNMLMFQLSEQQTLENLDLQTRKAYEQVIISREYLAVAEGVISLAEKSYSIARKAYEIGSKTLLEYQDAEFRLNKAKTEMNSALFKFHTAVINLRFLMSEL